MPNGNSVSSPAPFSYLLLHPHAVPPLYPPSGRSSSPARAVRLVPARRCQAREATFPEGASWAGKDMSAVPKHDSNMPVVMFAVQIMLRNQEFRARWALAPPPSSRLPCCRSGLLLDPCRLPRCALLGRLRAMCCVLLCPLAFGIGPTDCPILCACLTESRWGLPGTTWHGYKLPEKNSLQSLGRRVKVGGRRKRRQKWGRR